MIEKVFPDWSGETVLIVATGPSVANTPFERAKGKVKTIVVKDAWKLCPWAEILYACDHHWWYTHKGVPKFEGLRLAYEERTVEEWAGLAFLKVNILRRHENLIFEKIGHIAWGGNSGFHAFNLAVQFGASKIILAGFDMRVDKGRHFFGNHSYASERPSKANVDAWAKIMDRQAMVLKERNVEVINCSLESAIQSYPKIAFEELF